ncbi:MAG: TetR/AcrR family transcriptional regulator [Bradymonadales bacterium]|jgi:AcrR family transcriptional regulator
MAYEREDLEQLLLDLSERALFRYGFKRFNLNEVAREARISKTTLYTVFAGKYELASGVIDRLLSEAEREMGALLEGNGSLLEKLGSGMEVIAQIYGKMDAVFLSDLENSLPELWERIDAARRKKEEVLRHLLCEEQKRGVVRGDLDASLMASMILTLVRGMYQPAYFLEHGVTGTAVGEVIMEILRAGIFNVRADRSLGGDDV